ncbi:MAG TPA: hypothetical protein VF062_20385, partial [Candidatus Limnocylindrales bacterium]
MNGELVQYFALATHATARLLDPQTTTTATDLEASHAAFQFTAAVTFDAAPGVDRWISQLAGTGADRVWLAVPDLNPQDGRGAAFAGGLRAGLLTTSPAGNRLWQATWQVGDR